MLWPGQDSWYQTGGVLSAFFGESMFAQLSARFFFMLTITGVVGGFAAAKTADPTEKSYIARTLSGLGAVGAVLGTASLYWFASTLTSDATIVSATRMPESFAAMMWAALAVTLVYFALTAWRPSVMNLPLTVAATLVILVLGLAPSETAREIVRKPGWPAALSMPTRSSAAMYRHWKLRANCRFSPKTVSLPRTRLCRRTFANPRASGSVWKPAA